MRALFASQFATMAVLLILAVCVFVGDVRRAQKDGATVRMVLTGYGIAVYGCLGALLAAAACVWVVLA